MGMLFCWKNIQFWKLICFFRLSCLWWNCANKKERKEFKHNDFHKVKCTGISPSVILNYFFFFLWYHYKLDDHDVKNSKISIFCFYLNQMGDSGPYFTRKHCVIMILQMFHQITFSKKKKSRNCSCIVQIVYKVLNKIA